MKNRLFRTKVGVMTAAAVVGIAGSLSYLTQPADGAAQRGAATIYLQNCARCHGTDGRAQTRKGRKVDAIDFTSGDWTPDTGHDTRIVTRGKGSMPAFGNKLTQAQISVVVQYIRRFK
jgi:mono/diheme cytochrome c family protein